MRSGSNFKDTPAVLIIPRADTSKFKPQLLLLEDMFIAKQTKQNERLLRRMKVKFRAAGSSFPNDMNGQRVAHTTQVTCFENILRIRRFIYSIFFRRCVIEMIDLLRSEVSLGEAMYPNAFLSLEFRLNTGYKLCLRDPRNCSVNNA